MSKYIVLSKSEEQHNSFMNEFKNAFTNQFLYINGETDDEKTVKKAKIISSDVVLDICNTSVSDVLGIYTGFYKQKPTILYILDGANNTLTKDEKKLFCFIITQNPGTTIGNFVNSLL